jgi:hypothetical protein
MMARFGNPCRNVMDSDDPIEDHNDHENKQSECEVVQEWIVYHFTPLLLDKETIGPMESGV